MEKYREELQHKHSREMEKLRDASVRLKEDYEHKLEIEKFVTLFGDKSLITDPMSLFFFCPILYLEIILLMLILSLFTYHIPLIFIIAIL